MKYVLANDTSGTSNPGCQGTVTLLSRGLTERGFRIASRVPVGYAYHQFSKCYAPSPVPGRGRRLWNRASRLLAPLKSSVSGLRPSASARRAFCEDRWNLAVTQLMTQLQPVWKDSPLLVVNGEGTIHDDLTGALALLGLVKAGKVLGKRVALVNCSVFGLSAALLHVIRDSVDYLTVREPISQRYLADAGITASLSADCLFLEGFHQRVEWKTANWIRDYGNYVVYTPGVLTAFGAISSQRVTEDVQSLQKQGLKVVYYVVEAEDEKLASVAAAAGAVVVPLGALKWQEVFPFLSQAKFVVSGRYHINIFSALAGTPFITMETNTPKIDGLLELLGEKPKQVASLEAAQAILVSDQSLSRCLRLASLSAELPFADSAF